MGFLRIYGGSLDPTPAEMAASRAEAEAARANGTAGPDQVHLEVRGNIDRARYQALKDQLDAAPYAREITMAIDSNGGDLFAVTDFFVIVRRHPAELKSAVIFGRAESGALICALAADRRVAHWYSSVLLHPCAFDFTEHPERWTAERISREAEYLRDCDRDLFQLIASRSCADVTTIAAEASNEAPSPMDWCVRNGIIHRVIEAAK